MIQYQEKEFRLFKHTLLLYVSPEHLFTPNATSVRFSRALGDVKGKCVFDIGTGVCPLGIWAALEGAREVHGVDPVEGHIELAKMNISKYGLEGIVHAYQGYFFSPFETDGIRAGLKADVIIGDVSGIAEAASKALGWYPPGVPTGGYDGTEIIIGLLERAPRFLNNNGELYFPIASDLSDKKKIMDVAKENFKSIIPAFDKDIRFPLTQEQMDALFEVYEGTLPAFITPQKIGEKYFWSGQIYRAF